MPGVVLVPALNGTLIDSKACTVAICSLSNAQLEYVPNYAGNLVYLFTFLTLSLIHVVLLRQHATVGFSLMMVSGLITEVFGYLGRIELHEDVFEPTSFLTYFVSSIIAPTLIFASIHICLAHLVVVYGKTNVRFSMETYTFLPVSWEFIILILQTTGSATSVIANRGTPKQQTGINTAIVGLAFHLASMAIFMIAGIDLVISIRRASRTSLNPDFSILRESIWFRAFRWAIATSTVLIFVRCCFRIVELKDGLGGGLANNETLFMVFEGPLIITAVLILAIFHPGRCLGGAKGWDATRGYREKDSKSSSGEVGRYCEQCNKKLEEERLISPSCDGQTPEDLLM